MWEGPAAVDARFPVGSETDCEMSTVPGVAKRPEDGGTAAPALDGPATGLRPADFSTCALQRGIRTSTY